LLEKVAANLESAVNPTEVNWQIFNYFGSVCLDQAKDQLAVYILCGPHAPLCLTFFSFPSELK